jgi:hypothetical protein
MIEHIRKLSLHRDDIAYTAALEPYVCPHWYEPLKKEVYKLADELQLPEGAPWRGPR